MASFGRPLNWPEDEKVALRFILDHAQDLTGTPGAAQDVAMDFIAIGLRRELPCSGHAGPPHRKLADVSPDAQSAFAVLRSACSAGPAEGPARQCQAEGPLFRPESLSDRLLPRRLASDSLRTILRHRLVLAGLPVDFATPHGLRSGFLTQAALDGAPLAAAMKLSQHRSAVQAQKYYADVEIADNTASDLLGD